MADMRSCVKTGCRWPAAATLSYRYDTAEVWLSDLSEDHPATHDLCPHHADNLTVPRGWTLVDDRRPLMVIHEPSADEVADGHRTTPPVPVPIDQTVSSFPAPSRPTSTEEGAHVSRYDQLLSSMLKKNPASKETVEPTDSVDLVALPVDEPHDDEDEPRTGTERCQPPSVMDEAAYALWAALRSDQIADRNVPPSSWALPVRGQRPVTSWTVTFDDDDLCEVQDSQRELSNVNELPRKRSDRNKNTLTLVLSGAPSDAPA